MEYISCQQRMIGLDELDSYLDWNKIKVELNNGEFIIGMPIIVRSAEENEEIDLMSITVYCADDGRYHEIYEDEMKSITGLEY